MFSINHLTRKFRFEKIKFILDIKEVTGVTKKVHLQTLMDLN